jgi:hypothetical protein
MPGSISTGQDRLIGYVGYVRYDRYVGYHGPADARLLCPSYLTNPTNPTNPTNLTNPTNPP